MKPYMRVAAMIVACLAITLCLDCMGIQALKKDGVQTIPLPDLQANPDKYDFMGAMNGNGVIVMLPKGTKIPMNVAAEMSFVSLEPGKNFMVFNRDVYLFISMKKTMISPDGERWAVVGDWKTIKSLFGVGQGDLTIGFGISKDDGTFVNINLKTK